MEINFTPAPAGFDSTGTLANILIADLNDSQIILAFDLNQNESSLAANINGVWYDSNSTQDWTALDKLIGREKWNEIIEDHQQEYLAEHADHYTAQLTSINDDGWDTITIFNNGDDYDTVYVPSTEDKEPYDEAVTNAIGGCEFTWLTDRF